MACAGSVAGTDAVTTAPTFASPLMVGASTTTLRVTATRYAFVVLPSAAVVVGSLLITLIRHADRVSMANLAQLVNVIAPIRAEPDGPAWRQPTFFPFRDAAHHARGSVVLPRIEGGTIETERHGRAPLVDAVATLDGDALTVFAVHRGLDEGAQLRIEIPANASLVSATVLAGPDGDRLATNTAFSEPVAPRPLEVHPETDAGTALSATLPPVSWAVLRLTLAP